MENNVCFWVYFPFINSNEQLLYLLWVVLHLILQSPRTRELVSSSPYGCAPPAELSPPRGSYCTKSHVKLDQTTTSFHLDLNTYPWDRILSTSEMNDCKFLLLFLWRSTSSWVQIYVSGWQVESLYRPQ